MKQGKQVGETLVMVGEEPQSLRYKRVVEGSIDLRSKLDRNDPDNVSYTEGKDFVVDYAGGTIRRLPGSELPDWRAHPTYGIAKFNHVDYPDYSNKSFTVYVDYQFAMSNDPGNGVEPAQIHPIPDRLAALFDKLERGAAVTYVVFGDSISTGAEASAAPRTYFNRFAETLRQAYPKAVIDVRMKAVGGETSRGAMERLSRDVIEQQPDLVTIGYGMNDQNERSDGTNSVSLEAYEGNIARMIDDIHEQTDAAVILITPCLPNPLWKYASTNVADYAATLRRLGERMDVAVADLQQIWLAELHAGKTPESLLLNNVNHPNDYGHMLYARALEQWVRN